MGAIVELCDGAYPGGEGRMRRHVGHALAVEQHRAAVAQAAHIVVAAPSHTAPLLTPLARAPAPPEASTFIGLPSRTTKFLNVLFAVTFQTNGLNG